MIPNIKLLFLQLRVLLVCSHIIPQQAYESVPVSVRLLSCRDCCIFCWPVLIHCLPYPAEHIHPSQPGLYLVRYTCELGNLTSITVMRDQGGPKTSYLNIGIEHCLRCPEYFRCLHRTGRYDRAPKGCLRAVKRQEEVG